jgi:hypothetical protein
VRFRISHTTNIALQNTCLDSRSRGPSQTFELRPAFNMYFHTEYITCQGLQSVGPGVKMCVSPLIEASRPPSCGPVGQAVTFIVAHLQYTSMDPQSR